MQAHLKEVFAAIRVQDGKKLSQKLSFGLWDNTFMKSLQDYVHLSTFSQRTQMMTKNCTYESDPWADIISEYTQACICLKAFDNPAQSFECMESASKYPFFLIFASSCTLSECYFA